VIFNRRKKLPLTIDANDAAAIAHEKEVLAREEVESHLGSNYSTPSEVTFTAMDSDLSDGWSAQLPNVVRGSGARMLGPFRFTGLRAPEPEKDRD